MDCEQTWPLSLSEQNQALEDGIAPYALSRLEHVCTLEDEHPDNHACACGASS